MYICIHKQAPIPPDSDAELSMSLDKDSTSLVVSVTRRKPGTGSKPTTSSSSSSSSKGGSMAKTNTSRKEEEDGGVESDGLQDSIRVPLPAALCQFRGGKATSLLTSKVSRKLGVICVRIKAQA